MTDNKMPNLDKYIRKYKGEVSDVKPLAIKGQSNNEKTNFFRGVEKF